MLSQLESKLHGIAEPTKFTARLDKLNATIDRRSAMIGNLTEQCGQPLVENNEFQSADVAQCSEWPGATVIRQRFTLLWKQYEKDLARFEIIAEAGNLLGYFRSGTCVLCGADPSGQHLNLDCGRTASKLVSPSTPKLRRPRGFWATFE